MKFTGYNTVKSWIVAVACSFIVCMALLPMRVSGMLFVAFLGRYSTDRQNASLFMVISEVLGGLTSPFVGYLAEIFELRTIIITGCLLSSAGVGICYFAEDIIIVTVCLGLICGIGICLQINLLPQILKQHFTKNIATANGVTWIGSCIGSFIVIPIIKMLLDFYGVSGALLFTCGIMLHTVPVAMLLRDPKNNDLAIFSEKQPNGNRQEHKDNICIDCNRFEKTVTNCSIIKENTTYLMKENNVTLKSCVTKDTDLIYTVQNTISCNESSKEASHQLMVNMSFQSYKINTNQYSDFYLEQIFNNEPKQGSFSEHSLTAKPINKYLKALKTLAIFKNPQFLVIIFSLGIYSYIDVFICIIVIDIAKDKGIVLSQEQFFLMMMQVAQILGYTCLGRMIDKGYLSSARFHAIGFLCMGLSCCGFIFSNSFSTMMVPVMLFGLCVAVYTSGSPSLVYEYVEEKNQSMAIATRCMLKAPLCLTIGPVLQYFRDTLGSYNGILYLLAASSVSCAVLLSFLPCIARCTNKKL